MLVDLDNFTIDEILDTFLDNAEYEEQINDAKE